MPPSIAVKTMNWKACSTFFLACTFIVFDAQAEQSPYKFGIGAGGGITKNWLGDRAYDPGFVFTANISFIDSYSTQTQAFFSYARLNPDPKYMPNVASTDATTFREIGLVEKLFLNSRGDKFNLYMKVGVAWVNVQMQKLSLKACRENGFFEWADDPKKIKSKANCTFNIDAVSSNPIAMHAGFGFDYRTGFLAANIEFLAKPTIIYQNTAYERLAQDKSTRDLHADLTNTYGISFSATAAVSIVF